MVYLKLIVFCIRQMSLMGLWQSGAELDGSEVLRQRALRHRKLKDDATRLLIQTLREDLARVGQSLAQARDDRDAQPRTQGDA